MTDLIDRLAGVRPGGSVDALRRQPEVSEAYARFDAGRFLDAIRLFERLVLSPTFEEFLTSPAYELLLT